MSIFQHDVSFKGFIRRFPISSILVLINTIFFVMTVVASRSFSFSALDLYRLGALYSASVFKYGEYYRLLAAIFLHGSIMHFLFNTLFGIVIICAGLEKLVGSLKFLFAYLGSGILSSIMIIIFSPNSLTVGASGAIYGVLGVFLFMILYRKHLLSYSDRIYIRNLFIINLVFTFVAPSISIIGHIGGVVAGFIIGFIILFNERDTGYYY